MKGVNDMEKTQQRKNQQRKNRDGIFRRKDGRWWARVVYYDSKGRHEAVRRAENISDAKDKREELLRLYKDHGPRTLMSANMIFEELAEYYEKNYAITAEY